MLPPATIVSGAAARFETPATAPAENVRLVRYPLSCCRANLRAWSRRAWSRQPVTPMGTGSWEKPCRALAEETSLSRAIARASLSETAIFAAGRWVERPR